MQKLRQSEERRLADIVALTAAGKSQEEAEHQAKDQAAAVDEESDDESSGRVVEVIEAQKVCFASCWLV